MDRESELVEAILKWFEKEGRDFPWRTENISPYHALVAERLLQRTKAEKVAKVFPIFLEKFPSPTELADSSKEEVANLLNPLGLQTTKSGQLVKMAKEIEENYGGEVPQSYDSLTGLTGVGDYTASAVLCMCYDKDIIMLDTNSARVLHRLFSISLPSDLRIASKLRKKFNQILPSGRAKDFNFSLIDLSAVFCTPDPSCSECPVLEYCGRKERSD